MNHPDIYDTFLECGVVYTFPDLEPPINYKKRFYHPVTGRVVQLLRKYSVVDVTRICFDECDLDSFQTVINNISYGNSQTVMLCMEVLFAWQLDTCTCQDKATKLIIMRNCLGFNSAYVVDLSRMLSVVRLPDDVDINDSLFVKNRFPREFRESEFTTLMDIMVKYNFTVSEQLAVIMFTYCVSLEDAQQMAQKSI